MYHQCTADDTTHPQTNGKQSCCRASPAIPSPHRPLTPQIETIVRAVSALGRSLWTKSLGTSACNGEEYFLVQVHMHAVHLLTCNGQDWAVTVLMSTRQLTTAPTACLWSFIVDKRQHAPPIRIAGYPLQCMRPSMGCTCAFCTSETHDRGASRSPSRGSGRTCTGDAVFTHTCGAEHVCTHGAGCSFPPPHCADNCTCNCNDLVVPAPMMLAAHAPLAPITHAPVAKTAHAHQALINPSHPWCRAQAPMMLAEPAPCMH